MAHIDDNKGGRSANVEINIVPVIDLMSVLIVFLLITAVWNQISMIQLATSVYGKKSEDQQVNDQEKTPDQEIPLRLDILKDGYIVNLRGDQVPIAMIGDEYDTQTLAQELRKVKEVYPDKLDIIIAVDDDIDYGSLVKGMDIAIIEKFPRVSIATGGTE